MYMYVHARICLHIRALVYMLTGKQGDANGKRVCVPIYTYVYLYMHIYVYTYLCIHMYSSIYLCIHIYFYMHTYARIHMHFDIFICIRICSRIYSIFTEIYVACTLHVSF